NWDDYIKTIQFNYNIRIQENLKFSPFELIYGRKPNLPYDHKEIEQTETIIDRYKRIGEQREKIMIDRRKDQKLKIKPLKKEQKLEEGEIVLRRNKNKTDKFDTKWTENGSCLLVDPNNERSIVEHRKNLKKILTNNKYKESLCEHKKVFEGENLEGGGEIENEESVKWIRRNCICFNNTNTTWID
ncbi:hypothetical protein COBT_000506, partial [Conglomerata obtusa]